MNKKRFIIFISFIIAAVGLIVGGVNLAKQSPAKKTKEQQQEVYKPKESLLKDVEHEQLKITNIDIKKIDKHYEFIFTITNTSDKVTDVQIINYVFYNKDGSEVGRIENELQPIHSKQSTNYIINSKDEKLFKAATIKIELSPLIIE